jgi:hypothetical protein
MAYNDTNGSARESRLCPTARKLLEDYTEAARDSGLLHEIQFQAIVRGDPEADARFGALIAAANEKKEDAKYAYMGHVQEHGCSVAGSSAKSGKTAGANGF